MKEIVLDTETTGISVKEGHRVVEIGCIELENLIPTKSSFHCYLINYLYFYYLLELKILLVVLYL